jgi:hypothetical protein
MAYLQRLEADTVPNKKIDLFATLSIFWFLLETPSLLAWFDPTWIATATTISCIVAEPKPKP